MTAPGAKTPPAHGSMLVFAMFACSAPYGCGHEGAGFPVQGGVSWGGASVQTTQHIGDDYLEARCRGGTASVDAKECFMAGMAQASGAGGRPVDLDKATVLWVLGCRKHDLDPSCTALLTETRTLQASGDPARAVRALSILEFMCSTGHVRMCNALADAYESGQGAQKNPRKALEIYEKDCSAFGVSEESAERANWAMTACQRAGLLVRHGADGVAANEAQALAIDGRGAVISKRFEELTAAENARAEHDRQAVEAKAREAQEARQDASEAEARAARRGADPGGGTGDGASAGVPRAGHGTSFGMTQAVACLQAKMSASTLAGCPGQGMGGSCDCNKVGNQYACNFDLTCPR